MYILPIFNINKNKNNKSTAVSFTGQRVDKGLERFSDFNKNRMPVTLTNYLNSVHDKTAISPIQAQRNAFEMLSIADTVEEIKSVFPDEPLFAELKTVRDTNSTSGILWYMKKLNPIMKDLGIAPLKSKEDFTVYLVKKVFLEAKTIDEINEDLDKDFDELFKSEFKDKNPKVPYVSGRILKSLGIKLPDTNYLNSLKFTRPGYSDEFGEIGSLALKIYYDSLSQEQRDALAKKSTAKLENWWSTLSQDKKLEMIAEDENTLRMQEDYKNYKKQLEKETEKQPTTNQITKQPEKSTDDDIRTKQTKIGSETLNRDDLFKRWAANKLALFEQNLSDEDRVQLNIKRARNASARWEQMTPAEKTDYISKLKTGSQQMRYVMIDAWNKSFGLLVDLSDFLGEKFTQRTAEEIYSKEAFSTFMSETMTEFWALHVEEAKQFGQEISKSWKEAEEAIANGKFEQFKTMVMEKRKIRIFDLMRYKAMKNAPQTNEIPKEDNAQSQTKVITSGTTTNPINNTEKAEGIEKKEQTKTKTLGLEFFTKVFVKQIEIWQKYLGDDINIDENNIEASPSYKDLPPEEQALMMKELGPVILAYLYTANKAMYAIAPELQSCNEEELRQIIPQLKPGTKKINVYKQDGTRLTARINGGYFDEAKAIEEFEELIKPLTEQEAKQIMKKYFPKNIEGEAVNMTDEARQKMFEYLKTYGNKYMLKLFSEEPSVSYDVQKGFYNSLKNCLGEQEKEEIQGLLDSSDYKYVVKNKADLIRKLQTRFPYFPKEFLNTYLSLALSSTAENKTMFSDFKKINLSTEYATMKGSQTFSPVRTYATLEEKINNLAMEQAIADVLNKATHNENLYLYEFEELCNLLHNGLITKKFPYKVPYVSIITNTVSMINFTKRPIASKIQEKYKEYMEECKDWLENIQTDKSLSKEEKINELLYILNPNENWENIDSMILKRIKRYEIEKDLD